MEGRRTDFVYAMYASISGSSQHGNCVLELYPSMETCQGDTESRQSGEF